MARPLPRFIERLGNKTYHPAPYAISDEARALHRSLVVIDLHADPLLWSRDLLARNDYGHVDVPRLIEGGVTLQTFSTVTQAPLGINIRRNRDAAPDMITLLAMACGWPVKTWTSRLERALHQGKALDAAVMQSGGRLSQVRTKQDLEEQVARKRPDKTAALLSIEGAQCLEGHVEAVDVLFALGVRMFGLTHFQDNDVGGSAAGQRKYGITKFGREVLEHLEWKKVAIDLAHSSPALFDDVLKYGKTPPLVSHTGACSACPNTRNLTDEQLKKIAAKDGIVGIGYWKDATGGTDAAAAVRSILAVIKVAGVRHAALGSDFDGAVPEPFDATGIPLITQGLLESGLSVEDIALVMGGNAFRYLSERLPSR